MRLCFIVYLALIYSQNSLYPEEIKINLLSEKELHKYWIKISNGKIGFGETELSFPVKIFALSEMAVANPGKIRGRRQRLVRARECWGLSLLLIRAGIPAARQVYARTVRVWPHLKVVAAFSIRFLLSFSNSILD